MRPIFDELECIGHAAIDAWDQYKESKRNHSQNEYASFLLWLWVNGRYEHWVKHVFMADRDSIEPHVTQTHVPIELYYYGKGHVIFALVPWGLVIEMKDKTQLQNHYQIAEWLKRKVKINLYGTNNESKMIDAACKLILQRKPHLIFN